VAEINFERPPPLAGLMLLGAHKLNYRARSTTNGCTVGCGASLLYNSLHPLYNTHDALFIVWRSQKYTTTARVVNVLINLLLFAPHTRVKIYPATGSQSDGRFICCESTCSSSSRTGARRRVVLILPIGA